MKDQKPHHHEYAERAVPLDRRLTKLLEVSTLLANTGSIDELTRRTVELATEELGFERIGIWFYDESPGYATGSFGIDEQGQIRDERGCRVAVNHLNRRIPDWNGSAHVNIAADVDLRDHQEKLVGRGPLAWAPVWDGHQHVGFINTDNMFSRRPFSEDDRRVFGLLVVMFGHIYVAKLREQELVNAHKALEEALADRDQALQALHQDYRASELQFRTLAETMAAAIVIYQGERNIFVNSAAERITGYTRGEIEHMPFWKVIHPDHQAALRQRGLDRQAGKEVPDAFDVRIRTKDGRDKWVAYCASTIEISGQPAVLGCAFDITEQKQALRELQESREGFRILAESTYEGIAIHDQGVLLQANDQFFKMFGYEPEELLNRQCIPLLTAPEHQEMVRERVENRMLDTYEVVFVRKDGTPFHAEARSREWLYQGKQVRVSIVRDLTDRKKHEEALRHTQKMQTVGSLASGLAHDFNNLLMTMGGHLDRLAAFLPADSPGHEHLKLVLRSVYHAAGITRALLTFSHRSPIQKKPANLSDLCHDVSRLLAPLLSTTIHQSWDLPTQPVMIETDPCLIQQVLMNLLINARDALPNGGEVHVSLRSVPCRPGALLPGQPPHLNGERGYAELRVRDSGTGISEELRPRIFEPFVTTKSRDRGTGLGLAVTYAIIQEHGGWIHVDSTPGEGSTFTVYLPIGRVSQEAGPATAGACRLDGLRILLVEDDEMVLALLRDALSDAGAQVTTATTVESAIGQVEQGHSPLDAAVVDLDLPDGSSQDFFLKFRERFPEGKRLMISGGALDRSMLAWAHEHEIPFLLKPFYLDDLSQLIHELVSR